MLLIMALKMSEVYYLWIYYYIVKLVYIFAIRMMVKMPPILQFIIFPILIFQEFTSWTEGITMWVSASFTHWEHGFGSRRLIVILFCSLAWKEVIRTGFIHLLSPVLLTAVDCDGSTTVILFNSSTPLVPKQGWDATLLSKVANNQELIGVISTNHQGFAAVITATEWIFSCMNSAWWR